MKSEEDVSRDSDPSRSGFSFMEDMDQAVEAINRHRWWVLSMFILTSSPGTFNAYHIMVSTFYAQSVPHWCQVPELQMANWTKDQIRVVSTNKTDEVNICSMIAWNYTHLAQLGYEQALEYIKTSPIPSRIPCEKFVFKEDAPKSTTVSEWNLVCDDKYKKSTVQGSIAIGKFFGGLIFGFLADKYGRKFAYVLACLTYIIFGPLAAISPSFWFFIVMRFIIGLAGSGCYESGFTILAELMSRNRRAMLGCIYNFSYPIGYMTLPLIAIAFPTWRNLQLAISLPALLLLIHCWFIPESPRWLLTKGYYEKAWNVIMRVDKSLVPQPRENVQDDQDDQRRTTNVSVFSKIIGGSQKLCLLYSSSELCKRIAIMYIAWFSASLSYYVLALNADNFSTSHHIYTFLSGLVEIPGYAIPLLILPWLGRKCTTAFLFFSAGSALVLIAAIPKDQTVLILVIALLGRFMDVAVFGVVVVYTSELFPTTVRNTAVGSSLAVSQFGSITAPYIVDYLSEFGWYIPSTLCGCVALVSGLLTLLLPETRGKPLLDTTEQVKNHPDHVSCYNCCSFT